MKNSIYYSLQRAAVFSALLALGACGGGAGEKPAAGSSNLSSAVDSSDSSFAVSSLVNASEVAASEMDPGSSSAANLSSLAQANSDASAASSIVSTSLSVASVAVSQQSAAINPSSAQSSHTSLASSSLPLGSSAAVASSSALPELQSLAIFVDKTELNLGESIQASVEGIYADNYSEAVVGVFWFSSDSSIAQIDAAGNITGLRAGQVTITAGRGSIGSNAISITIKLVPENLRELHLHLDNALPAMVGDKRTLLVTGDYASASGVAIPVADVDLASSDAQVASIANGIVTAQAVGRANITASYKGKSAMFNLEVIPLGISFYFLKPASWKNTIKAHWWSNTTANRSTFPGVDMLGPDADGWYSITIKGAEDVNVLFDDGGSASANFHQTSDQLPRNGGWFIPSELPNANGKYYGTWSESKPVVAAQPVCDVSAFGARGDGRTKDTLAIQKAIDACAGKNGIVKLRNGKFVAGTIVLKSDMTLRVEATATLLGTRDTADYPSQPALSGNSQYGNCRKALIYAEKANNIRIDGGGVIDGNGADGSPWIAPARPQGQTQEQRAEWDAKIKAEYGESTRPMAIFIVQSKGVVVENVQIKNSAMWTLVPFESDDVIIRGVKITSVVGANRDGIDIVDGHNLLIEDVEVTSQDDAICLKSGIKRGLENVLVRNSKVLGSGVANGLKFGTATTGPFKNITFDNISLANVTRGGIAVESVDGSAVSNILFRNIKMTNVGTPFYIVLGDRSNNRAAPRVGTIENITFENIVATAMAKTYGSYMSGVSLLGKTYKLNNLTFKDIDLTFKGGSTNVGAQPEYNALFNSEYPDPGNARGAENKKDMPAYLYFRHVDNLNLTNVKVQVAPQDSRPLIIKEDASNVVVNN